MLRAKSAGALSPPNVSVPPKKDELSEVGQHNWTTGTRSIKTCVDTYRTASGLSPEIVHFGEKIDSGEGDWFIKDAKLPGQPPVYDARYILRPKTVGDILDGVSLLIILFVSADRDRAHANAIACLTFRAKQSSTASS